MNARQALLALWLTSAAAAAAACELPTPAVPPATGAGDDRPQHIVAAQRYVTGIEAYLTCTRAELAAAGGEAAPQPLRSVLIRRNNNAVAEAKVVLTLFAERVAPVEELYLAEFVAGDAEECLTYSRRLMTGVVDDHAVLFVDRNGRSHLNVLETACTDLARFGHFDVRTKAVGVASPLIGPVQTNRLCSNEFILPYAFEDAPLRNRECALGRFFELTREQTQRLTALRATTLRSVAGDAEGTSAPPSTELPLAQ